MILLVDVYHEFSHPVQMLTSMRAALKPEGQLVLVEFRAEDDTVPIKPEHKMTKDQITKEMNANGFELKRQYDGLPWQHLMFFGKSAKEEIRLSA
jgi:ubiquinone/menaquinone biosynthesis C-methylase UbiE